ncbi:DUF4905 domain-containing protein [Melioribacter sp. OK-6-Me]|uniref:DUF4905 domain-containing protein n=1 Tax=unclassified Melioribacter TaxID=2627329 RepID=UPI003EDB1212
MNIKKHFTVKSNWQVWRILISESDYLVIESRDKDTKEVSFHSYDLKTGNTIFENFQLDEKYYVGIETVYKDILYFHKYPKPDLPNHKGITAFDISSSEMLWDNDEYSFLFAHDEKLYCFKQGFDERYFYTVDYKTGKMLEDMGNDYRKINALRMEADQQNKYEDYSFPKLDFDYSEIKPLILENLANLEVYGNIEYATYNNLLMFNYHLQEGENLYTNYFRIINVDNSNLIFEEVLNNKASSLFTDSFFIYKDYLILLKEKDGLNIYKLEM